MAGFVANTPATTETDITNDGFFPAISLTDCRAVIRLDQDITTERLRHSLINAISAVNWDLTIWKVEQETNGHADLAAVPARQIDGASEKLNLYQRAVYNHAKAEINERYRDYDSTLNATQRAEELDETIDQYRRESIIAVRALMEQPRSTIELI